MTFVPPTSLDQDLAVHRDLDLGALADRISVRPGEVRLAADFRLLGHGPIIPRQGQFRP
jgi:hypothetical protein